MFNNWIIAVNEAGSSTGLRTVDALQRLGIHHTQTMFGLANPPAEWTWYAIAVSC